MKTTEAERKVQRKYYLKHKEYYMNKANEEMKKVRRERHEYKTRIEKAITYIDKHPVNACYELLNIYIRVIK